MKKTIKVSLGIILFLLFLIISFFVFKHETGELEKQYKKICCNNTCFNIEIADDKESRELGLMYRKKLPENNGMLFSFNTPGIHSFWMKNTLIPLAGIRLDSNLKIVDIILMNPCEVENCPIYTPKSDAQYVLEINQGVIYEKGLLHTGDYCKITNY